MEAANDHPTTAGLQFTPNRIATCFRPLLILVLPNHLTSFTNLDATCINNALKLGYVVQIFCRYEALAVSSSLVRFGGTAPRQSERRSGDTGFSAARPDPQGPREITTFGVSKSSAKHMCCIVLISYCELFRHVKNVWLLSIHR